MVKWQIGLSIFLVTCSVILVRLFIFTLSIPIVQGIQVDIGTFYNSLDFVIKNSQWFSLQQICLQKFRATIFWTFFIFSWHPFCPSQEPVWHNIILCHIFPRYKDCWSSWHDTLQKFEMSPVKFNSFRCERPSSVKFG